MKDFFQKNSHTSCFFLDVFVGFSVVTASEFQALQTGSGPCHANGCDPQQSCVQDGVNQSTARPVVNVAFLGSLKNGRKTAGNPPWALAFRTTLAGLMKQIEIDFEKVWPHKLWTFKDPSVCIGQGPSVWREHLSCNK